MTPAVKLPLVAAALSVLVLAGCGGQPPPARQAPPPTETSVPEATVTHVSAATAPDRRREILARVMQERGFSTLWSDDLTRFEAIRLNILIGGGWESEQENIQHAVEPAPNRPGSWLVTSNFSIEGEPISATWIYDEEEDRVITASEWAALIERGVP